MLRNNCQGFMTSSTPKWTPRASTASASAPGAKRYFANHCYPKKTLHGPIHLQRTHGPNLPCHHRRRSLPFLEPIRRQGHRQGQLVCLAPGFRLRPSRLPHVPHLLGHARRRHARKRHRLSPALHAGRHPQRRPSTSRTNAPTTWSAISARTPAFRSTVPAGSIACFSSYVFHRSGPNLTNKLRRIYLPQYSPQVIYGLDGKQWGQAVPFLKNGEIVWRDE